LLSQAAANPACPIGRHWLAGWPPPPLVCSEVADMLLSTDDYRLATVKRTHQCMHVCIHYPRTSWQQRRSYYCTHYPHQLTDVVKQKCAFFTD
jgi:hypothetical protein